jgi:hypothetical protein
MEQELVAPPLAAGEQRAQREACHDVACNLRRAQSHSWGARASDGSSMFFGLLALQAVALLRPHGHVAPTGAIASPRPKSPRVAAPARLQVSTASSAAIAATAAKGAALFNNMRIPSSLAAGAVLSLGFGFPFGAQDKEASPRLKLLGRLNVIVGFLSLVSELLAIVMCTNAVNRLSGDVKLSEQVWEDILSDRMARRDPSHVLGLLSTPEFKTFWVGAYFHFVLGIFGILVMAGMRAFIVGGDGFSGCMLLLSVAGAARMGSAINRGSVVRDFGSGNVLLLAARYFKWTLGAALRKGFVMDLVSFAFLAAAVLRIVWAIITDRQVDGDGFW